MKRKVCFDFVKGYFVLAMAVYHWMNYCIIGHDLVYKYVDYVSEGFIFFSGYLCGEVYFYRFKENKIGVIKRLGIRSVKIFCLFVFLNVIIYTFLGGARGSSGDISVYGVFVQRFYDVFIVGDDSLMAFEILLPISYMLALCPLFFFSFRVTLSFFILILVYLFVANIGGVPASYNAKALMIGFGGICTSMLLNHISCKRAVYINAVSIIMAIVYFAIFVPFIHISGIMVKYVEINIVVLNLIIVCHALCKRSLFVSELSMLGKFSLLLYLFQILYLQIVSLFLVQKNSYFTGEVLGVLLLLLLTSSLLCRAVSFGRRISPIFDRMYMIVFQ